MSSGVSVGVQYLGEGGLSWTDVVGVKGRTGVGVNDVGVKGVRDAKESVDLRGVGCEMVSSFLQGVVWPQWCVCPTRHVDRNKAMISSSGRVFLWYRLWLMMFPVAEASLSLSGPAGPWLAGTRPKSMWQGFHCRL